MSPRSRTECEPRVPRCIDGSRCTRRTVLLAMELARTVLGRVVRAVGRTGRVRIKQKFVPTSEPIEFFYPPKWKLNDKIRVDQPQPAAAP